MHRSGKTNLTTPIIILVILGVLMFVVFGNRDADSDPEAGSNPLQAGMLVDVERDSISRLDVSTPKGVNYSLLKQDDKWFALRDGEQFPADESRTGKLLDDLPDLASEALMSEKAEQHATFELNEDQAYTLAVYAGGSDPRVTLLVGKSTPNIKGCYIRRSGEDEVYKASANLRTSLGYSFDDYRSKQPWPYDPALATALTVTPVTETGEITGEPMSFSKDGEFWTLDSDGSNGNQNDIQELVDKFSGLRIQTFVDDTSVMPLDQYDPDAVASLVVTSAGEEYSFTIHGREENNTVVSDGTGRVYKTSRSNLNFLLDLDFAMLSFYEEPEVEADAAAGDAELELDGAAGEADAEVEGSSAGS